MDTETAKTDNETTKTETKSASSGGGVSGFFRRLWYYLKFLNIGIKWNLIELFTFHKKFDLKKVPRRPGEVAVITGGARGIGKEVIRKLLILDMHVIIGCRNETSGQEMVDKFRKSGINTGSTEVISLDLMSLESVRDFGNSILAKYSKIHVLINNAGIMAVPRKITKDGFESQFQVNYLSHFLLSNMLLPKLIKAGRPGKASRIVNVSSVAHYGGIINFEDINMEQLYSAEMAYMSSKLMQVVTTRDLDSRLAKENVHVKVYAVHPGVVKTDLYEHICLARVFGFIFRLLYKTPEQGADGVLFTAISSKFEGEGGLFFANCKKNSPNKLSKNPEIQKRLWDLSSQLAEWEDIPISELVKQSLASRGTRPPKPSSSLSLTNEIRILDEVSSPVEIGPKKYSATESIKNALEPLKFIDDLEEIDEQEFQDEMEILENSEQKRSSASSSSLSSKSSLSSTGTVIRTPVNHRNFEIIDGELHHDGNNVIQIETDPLNGLTTPEKNLLVELGILPVEDQNSGLTIVEIIDDDAIEDSSPSNNIISGDEMTKEKVALTSISESFSHESTTSSFSFERTSISSFNYETYESTSNSVEDLVGPSSSFEFQSETFN